MNKQPKALSFIDQTVQKYKWVLIIISMAELLRKHSRQKALLGSLISCSTPGTEGEH